MRDRLIEILDKTIAIKDENTDDYNEWLADELLANGVIVLPCKMPDELYRIMFENDGKAVAVKCKVGKITRQGFTLVHYLDGREWNYKYTEFGEHIFYSEEEITVPISFSNCGEDKENFADCSIILIDENGTEYASCLLENILKTFPFEVPSYTHILLLFRLILCGKSRKNNLITHVGLPTKNPVLWDILHSYA